jgi:hypothetical protein
MKTQLITLGLFAILATTDSDASGVVSVPDFAVTCSTGIQLCEPAFSVSVDAVSIRQPIQLKYDVAVGHCSPVRLHIFVDGALVKTTPYLGWVGASAPFDSLPLSTGYIPLKRLKPGPHVVSVNAEGQEGGCNGGQLFSWGGSLEVVP